MKASASSLPMILKNQQMVNTEKYILSFTTKPIDIVKQQKPLENNRIQTY